MNKYKKWLNNLGRCWKYKDFKSLREIFSSNITYYENPHQEPLKNVEDILNQWNIDLKNQKNISFSYEIIKEDDSSCVANWNASFTIKKERYVYDGIYHFRLNENNECTYFKQWWVRR